MMVPNGRLPISGGFKEGAIRAWDPPWPIRCAILKYHYTNISVFIKICTDVKEYWGLRLKTKS